MVDSVKSSTPMFGTMRQNDDGKVKLNQNIQGIDYGEYIGFLTKPYELRITQNKDKISTNEKTIIPAIEDIRSKLKALKGALKPLSDASQSILDPSIFNRKNANFSANDNAIEMIIPPTMNVSDQAFSLSVTQLAKNDQIQSNSGYHFTGPTQTITGYGNLVINGQTVINVVNGVTTLQDVVNAVNLSTSSTNVVAEAALTKTGEYTLLIKGTQTSTPISIAGTDASLRNATGGLYLPDTNQPSTLESLQAQVVYNGVTYYRSSNTAIDDIVVDPIRNVAATINLLKPSSSPTIGTISYDRDGINSAVQDFVAIYNAVQDGIDTYRNDETLKKSKEFQNFLKGVDKLLDKGRTNAAKGVDPTVNVAVLAQIGITKSEVNPHHLEINEKKLKSFTHGTSDQLSNIANLFQAGHTSTNTDFSAIRRPNALSSIAGKNITVSHLNTGSGFQTTLSASGLADVVFTSSETSITGPSGTPYEGMSLNYSGSILSGQTAVTTLVFCDGIASQLSNNLEEATTTIKSTSGAPTSLCDRILAAIDKQDKKFQQIVDETQKKSDRAVIRAEAEYDKLVQAYNSLKTINEIIDGMNAEYK